MNQPQGKYHEATHWHNLSSTYRWSSASKPHCLKASLPAFRSLSFSLATSAGSPMYCPTDTDRKDRSSSRPTLPTLAQFRSNVLSKIEQWISCVDSGELHTRKKTRRKILTVLDTENGFLYRYHNILLRIPSNLDISIVTITVHTRYRNKKN